MGQSLISGMRSTRGCGLECRRAPSASDVCAISCSVSWCTVSCSAFNASRLAPKSSRKRTWNTATTATLDPFVFCCGQRRNGSSRILPTEQRQHRAATSKGWLTVPSKPSVTNQDIVPYNQYLLLKYDCYTCCDVINPDSIVKYLKCVHEGQEFARAKIGTVVHEIEQYLNARCVSACGVIRLLFGFVTVSRIPAVTARQTHLENDHRVQMSKSPTHEQRLLAADSTTSALVEYLRRHTSAIFDEFIMLDYYDQ